MALSQGATPGCAVLTGDVALSSGPDRPSVLWGGICLWGDIRERALGLPAVREPP